MIESQITAENNEDDDRFLSSSLSQSDDSHGVVVQASSLKGRVSGPVRRLAKGGWSTEEDTILAEAVKTHNGKGWKKIAECLPGRTDVQCLHRWQKVLDPCLIKGPWTKVEDNLITEMVKKLGNTKWSQIAKALPGRIGKQCRERWHNHLNPDIKKTPWTKEEESVLIDAHRMWGNKWAELAKILPGRTENSIKNHWNSSAKRRLIFSSPSSSGGPRSMITESPEPSPEPIETVVEEELSLELTLGTPSINEKKKHSSSPQERFPSDETVAFRGSGLSTSAGPADKPIEAQNFTNVNISMTVRASLNTPQSNKLSSNQKKSKVDVAAKPPRPLTGPSECESETPKMNYLCLKKPPSSWSQSTELSNISYVLKILAASFETTPSIMRKRKRVSLEGEKKLSVPWQDDLNLECDEVFNF